MPYQDTTEQKTEYKTLRVTAPTYNKLVELAGMLSVITGETMSISQLADNMINIIHVNNYAELLETVADPDKVRKIRNQLAHNAMQVQELLNNAKVTD